MSLYSVNGLIPFNDVELRITIVIIIIDSLVIIILLIYFYLRRSRRSSGAAGNSTPQNRVVNPGGKTIFFKYFIINVI